MEVETGVALEEQARVRHARGDYRGSLEAYEAAFAAYTDSGSGGRDRAARPVLDIGCGTGKSSRDAALRAREGSVLGVDASSRMLDEARRRSADEGVANVKFLCADAQVHPFEPGSFDVAISAFGAMLFADPAEAFTNVRRSLRPGGRVAFLAWQRFEHNEWLTTIFDALAAGRDLPAPAPGEPGPFGLADPEAVTTLLRDACARWNGTPRSDTDRHVTCTKAQLSGTIEH